jgi:hypothetical protein
VILTAVWRAFILAPSRSRNVRIQEYHEINYLLKPLAV